MLFHHPYLAEVADLEFHPLEVASPEAAALVTGWCGDATTLTSVVVCFDNDPLALDIALQLLPVFQRTGVRVAVRLPGQGGLAHLLEEAQARRPGLTRIRAFGLDEQFAHLAAPEDEPVEKFARDIHGAYVRLALQQAESQPGGADAARQRPELQDWAVLPEDFRESNRQQAAHLYFKLRAVACEAVPKTDPRPGVAVWPDAELELLARLEHDRWVAERRVAGWVYGKSSDKARRINQNLVPWNDLHPDTRQYDYDAVRRIPALLDLLGLKVCRRDGARPTA